MGTGGLQTWISGNIIPLLLFVIAAMMLMVAGKGDNAKLFRILGGVLIALAVLGLATGGKASQIGTWLWNLVTGM